MARRGQFWRRVVRVDYERRRGVRVAVGGLLECGHEFTYERRRRPRYVRGRGSAVGVERECVECAGTPLPERPRARPAPARERVNGASPDLLLLRAALKRLIQSTRTSPAPEAVRRFCFEALGNERSEEALLYVETLQRLGEVCVEFLNGHPYGERAMRLREEMDRLARVAGLIASPLDLPEVPGQPRRVVKAEREED